MNWVMTARFRAGTVADVIEAEDIREKFDWRVDCVLEPL
jgi:hypothetical protein